MQQVHEGIFSASNNENHNSNNMLKKKIYLSICLLCQKLCLRLGNRGTMGNWGALAPILRCWDKLMLTSELSTTQKWLLWLVNRLKLLLVAIEACLLGVWLPRPLSSLYPCLQRDHGNSLHSCSDIWLCSTYLVLLVSPGLLQ